MGSTQNRIRKQLYDFLDIHMDIGWHYFVLSEINEEIKKPIDNNKLLELLCATRRHIRMMITAKKKIEQPTESDEARLKETLKLINNVKKKLNNPLC